MRAPWQTGKTLALSLYLLFPWIVATQGYSPSEVFFLPNSILVTSVKLFFPPENPHSLSGNKVVSEWSNSNNLKETCWNVAWAWIIFWYWGWWWCWSKVSDLIHSLENSFYPIQYLKSWDCWQSLTDCLNESDWLSDTRVQ